MRALVRGGAKYQQMLIDAFAEHVLGVKAHAQKIKPPTLDLSMLRTGFDVPEVFEDGFRWCNSRRSLSSARAVI